MSDSHRFVRLGLALVIAGLACADATTRIQRVGSQYPPKPRDCEIEFFDREMPSRPFEEIAKVETHIKRNVFLGGQVSFHEDAYDELGEKACELGGDAVVIDDHMESGAAEMTHVHVWATILRYR